MLLSFLPEFTTGSCFLAFLFISIYSWTIFLTTTPGEAKEMEGHQERVFKFAEWLVWTEIGIGFVVFSIAIGSWLRGLL